MFEAAAVFTTLAGTVLVLQPPFIFKNQTNETYYSVYCSNLPLAWNGLQGSWPDLHKGNQG